ncbi:MAG: hypothetical protein ACH255_19960 [Candidatus Thiodiazotropha sp.]
MEDDKNERKTKTISFTVYEDAFDVDEQAILDTLVNREMETGNYSRTAALGMVLFDTIYAAGELRLGVERVNQIMEEAFEKKQEMSEAVKNEPNPPEL